MLPQLRMPVGALILSAKPEEMTQVTNVVTTYFAKDVQPLLHGFPTYRLPGGSGEIDEALILANCGQMGNVAAASRTAYLLAAFRPNLTIFVGTAGSLRPDKCKVFDVVVPTLGVSATYYDKLEDAGGGRFNWGTLPQTKSGLAAYTSDKKSYSLRKQDRTLYHVGVGDNYITQASSGGPVGTNLATGLEKFSSAGRPAEVHVDTYMFSWEKVVASENYRALLAAELNSKAWAVDMESFGFLSVFNQFQKLDGGLERSSLIVRGISDVCGDKNSSLEDGRNDKATRNAAHVACRVIRDGYMKL